MLSGTHRHLAAQLAHIKLPVTIWLRSDIEAMFGTELWANVIKDISVKELKALDIKEGFSICPFDKVNFDEIYRDANET